MLPIFTSCGLCLQLIIFIEFQSQIILSLFASNEICPCNDQRFSGHGHVTLGEGDRVLGRGEGVQGDGVKVVSVSSPPPTLVSAGPARASPHLIAGQSHVPESVVWFIFPGLRDQIKHIVIDNTEICATRAHAGGSNNRNVLSYSSGIKVGVW